MNTSYATLQNYNEDYETSPTINSINYEVDFGGYHVFEAFLDGDTLEPETDSDATASLILILDREKNGFFVSLRVQHLKDATRCSLFSLQNFVVNKEIIKLFSMPIKNYYSGKLVSKFFNFANLKIPVQEFLQYLFNDGIVVSMSTETFPNGEIEGILKKIY